MTMSGAYCICVFAKGRWCFGDVRQTFGESGKVEPGPANNDGTRAIVQKWCYIAQPMPRGIRDLKPDMTIKPMWRAAFFLGRRARGQHAPVGKDLKRVGIDDLSAAALGNTQGQSGLPTRRWPGNQNRAGGVNLGQICHGAG